MKAATAGLPGIVRWPVFVLLKTEFLFSSSMSQWASMRTSLVNLIQKAKVVPPKWLIDFSSDFGDCCPWELRSRIIEKGCACAKGWLICGCIEFLKCFFYKFLLIDEPVKNQHICFCMLLLLLYWMLQANWGHT